jgi:hypothetical protein
MATFCGSSGNVTDEVVAEYIANQGEPGPEDFRVEEGDFEPTSVGRTSSPPRVGDFEPTFWWVAFQPSFARHRT